MAQSKGFKSAKRALINRASTTVVVVVCLAVSVVIFSVFATKTYVAQARYQNKVIAQKKQARDQLKADIEAEKDLKKSYQAFERTTINAINGNSAATGPRDGTNTKLVLDALPSLYDFPALVTSLESLTASQNVKISSINGSDDELNQATNTSSSTPTPIAMPFSLGITADYNGVQRFVKALEQSIRPMQVLKMDIAGGAQELTVTINAQTFFQPAKSLKITTKVVQP
jgi:hypothetical protein